MTVYKAISDLIGNTPLVELTHIEEKEEKKLQRKPYSGFC